ncbi:MAG: aminopeptidase P family protein [Thermoanaerobaculales bacterium]|jgi:Xaa-Pro aminopeptidase|nr:aminopeptidase P family protein [Thermoanaerobaculales bacterium]
MFPTHIYDRRRQALRSRFEGGMLLFLGNAESPMNYADNAYPFRQDSSFLYYFGLDQPDLAAVMDLDEGWTAIFGDELTIDDIVWMGDLPTISDRAQRIGVTDVRPRDALGPVVGRAVGAGREVRYLPPYRAEHTLELSGVLRLDAAEVEGRASLDLIRAVVDQRNVKSDEEVVEIERAVTTSVEMHVAAMRMARPGMREADVAAEVERVALAAGGGVSFPVIATVNGQILHNHFHGNTLAEGDLFLLDAGAQTAMRYAGDLSSTFPVSPTFTGRQRTIYEIQLASYNAAIEMLAPGVAFRDVHFAACRVIAEGMKDLGLMKGNTDDALASGAHAMFFPCGLGHMMGLDVHDMESLGEGWVGWNGEAKSTQFGLKSLRLGRELEPGFVLTVEPGIYFVPQLMDLWRSEGRNAEFLDFDRLDAWRGFGGIRNEEDFVITGDGARRLGPAKPVAVDEIEALRS